MPGTSFLRAFPNFHYDDDSTLLDNFYQLAENRRWADDSKLWRLNWRNCFGFPYHQGGPTVDGYFGQFPGFCYITTNTVQQNFNILAKWKGWAKKTEDYREEWSTCLASFFAKHYGSNDEKLAAWQDLCRDAGHHSPPTSVTKCKKVMGSPKLLINIVDMIEYRVRKERYEQALAGGGLPLEPAPPLPRRFENVHEFVEYTRAKRFPKDAAKTNPLLKSLLRVLH
ncbi:MAG: hypothetical protein M1820_005929 [Bogoriella megaspora]|nr:MAG: hypothetical protein M1820_005929 [Bogoriella megaspora]